MSEAGTADRPLVVVGSHVCGLVLEVDAVPREGETVLGRSFREPEDGGKATNQAVAAAKLGAPVRVVTLLGDDERGRHWHDLLAGHGLDVRYVLKAPGATDVGIVMLPPSGIPAIVSCIDLGVGLDGAAIESRPDAFDGASVVICQLEASVECARAAFQLGRSVGARTVLNTAPARPLDLELLDLVDVVVANEHEAASLLGNDGAPALLAAELGRLRKDWTAIVTAGKAGCYVACAGLVEHLPAPSVDAVDTTGAGDQFVAALAVRLRAGDDVSAAAQFSVLASALSVSRLGTMPSFVAEDELSTAVSVK